MASEKGLVSFLYNPCFSSGGQLDLPLAFSANKATSAPFLHVLFALAASHLNGPPLNSVQLIYVSLGQGGLKLSTILQVQPLQCCVEENNHIPQPAGYTCAKAALHEISFHC